MIWRSSHEALLLLLCWLAVGITAFAQHPGVEVRSPAATLLDTMPGRIVTTSVVVRNRESVLEEFTERLTLPEGCQKVAPPDLPFRIPPDGQAVRVIAIAVPAT